MPRQSRGPTAAPKRPTAAPPTRAAAPSPQAPPKSRQASTAAHPPQGAAPPAQAPVQTSSGPGLFGTMASTAAGAVVGTSIGHAIGGFFGGGSSSHEAAPAPADQPLAQNDQGQYVQNSAYQAPQVCAGEVGNFRKCMDENQGNLTICGWYLDQLKACQATASQY